MSKKESIARYSADEIQSMIARGESKTDWAKTGAVSQQEVEAGISADADEPRLQFDWSKASPVLPEPKAILHMRVDRDVLQFFRKQGRGYQTTINAVLRSYVEQLSAHNPR